MNAKLPRLLFGIALLAAWAPVVVIVGGTVLLTIHLVLSVIVLGGAIDLWLDGRVARIPQETA